MDDYCYAKMATSWQRESERQSATSSKSHTEMKMKTEDEDTQQLTGLPEDVPVQLQVGSSTLKQEDPQPPHIKEEEEELCITQEGECLLGREEADLSKLPLTVVSVKTEDDEEKPQPDNTLAPPSDSESEDEVEVTLSGDTDCEVSPCVPGGPPTQLKLGHMNLDHHELGPSFFRSENQSARTSFQSTSTP
ncbi:uncharacterized protein LOC133549429 isoform X4 [Nerophis ophidion]|uniref:uncharacterized protein LOC133549429 isoform X4 n=1 Tax=Nerophis ophidion TaxID=159077 RepID=UPI002AE05946|nr:uncharacterized protein LOC133549429 isoform X4 [Nerophis ophidion]